MGNEELGIGSMAGGGPVPFRLRILEDMLDQECWAEESDSELLEGLSLEDEAGGGEEPAIDGDACERAEFQSGAVVDSREDETMPHAAGEAVQRSVPASG